MAHDTFFQTVTPESVGIPSAALTAFLQKLRDYTLHEHSLLVLRHGKICAEGYVPFAGEEKLHRIYSSSKTFVTATIGRLIMEGRLGLNDKVAPYFQDLLPETVPPEVEEMTVRHLLMMATPFSETTYSFAPSCTNWISTFFNTKPSHLPGAVFRYDTSGTYTLNVLAERLTGKPIAEYLRETVFADMGFSEDAWCIRAPEGHSWCGSGMMCTSRDLAKLALVFLNGGCVNGKQVLPEDFVREATSRQIDNNTLGQVINPHNGHGYGYFIWRSWKNSYLFQGMGDQLAITVPDKDLILVTTADNQGNPRSMTDVMEAFWECVVERVSDDPLPEDPSSFAAMREAYGALSLPVPEGEKHSAYEAVLQDRVYEATRPNEMGITRFSFHFEGDTVEFRYTNARGDKKIVFGLGHYEHGVLPERYAGACISEPMDRGYETEACAVFTAPQQLLLRCDVVDWYLGNFTAVFGFRDDVCGFRMTKNAENFLHDYAGWGEGKAVTAGERTDA